MSEVWSWSAYVGVLLGLVALIALFAPILVWQSRRFGRLTAGRTVAAGAAAIYGVTLLAYTLLPLPSSDWCDLNPSRDHLLRPLHSVDDIRAAVEGMSPGEAMRTFTVLQVVMNVVLFIPWGVFARRLFGRSILVATASALVMSVLIETSQGTGLFGIYSCAYRTADIDDVIANTLGGLVGAVVSPLLLNWWVPDADADERVRLTPRRVTRTRRVAGMIVDGAAFFGVWALAAVGARVIVRYEFDRPIADADDVALTTIPALIAMVVVVIVPLWWTSGASLGQRAVWLAPAPGARRGRLVARAAAGFGGFAALSALATFPALAGTAASTLEIAGWALAATSLLAALVDRTARGLSYRVAGLDITDRRTTSEHPDPLPTTRASEPLPPPTRPAPPRNLVTFARLPLESHQVSDWRGVSRWRRSRAGAGRVQKPGGGVKPPISCSSWPASQIVVRSR